MRVRTALVVLGLSATGLLPAVADSPAAPAAPAPQSVTGSIAAPSAIVARSPRTLALTDRRSNGLTGYVFDVDPATVGGAFSLKVTSDPTTQGDLQVGFYSDLGTAQDAATLAGEYVTEATGGEAGFVPEGTRYVLVYLYVGAQVGFSYTATPPPSVDLAGTSLDASIPWGGSVRFTNSGATAVDYTHVPSKGQYKEFSGTLDAGSSVLVTPSSSGTFAYTAGTRSGVLTVTD